MRAITRDQQLILMECHERQMLCQNPLSVRHSRSAVGLVQRGLLCVKTHPVPKPYQAFFLTGLGRTYLTNVIFNAPAGVELIKARAPQKALKRRA